MLTYFEGLSDDKCVPESMQEFMKEELNLAQERRDFLRRCLSVGSEILLNSQHEISEI